MAKPNRDRLIMKAREGDGSRPQYVTWRLVDSNKNVSHEKSISSNLKANFGRGMGGPNFYYEPVVPAGTYQLQVEVNGFRQTDESITIERGQDVQRTVELKSKKK
ncbi:MAG: hypothetical protein ACI97A_001150 [Planctomycetota bacterium]|jgi:hypothetical protein